MGYTGDEAREIAGVTSIIKVSHEGPTKKPTEEKAMRSLEGWETKSGKTPKEFYARRRERLAKEHREKWEKEDEKEAVRAD